LRKIEGILKGRKVDFLFIDADHSYEGVKKDFEMYSPLVRKGGIIAFHDIIPDYYTRYGIKTSSWAVRFIILE
jgi:predicted O-methyltransferase YrrM